MDKQMTSRSRKRQSTMASPKVAHQPTAQVDNQTREENRSEAEAQADEQALAVGVNGHSITHLDPESTDFAME
ncbi:hypothetical protein ACJZ2D_000414 [Fusarium nematophilum]